MSISFTADYNDDNKIQQHLESIHVSNLLVPMPDGRTILSNIISQSKRMLELKEDSFVAAATVNEHLQTMMNVLQNENNPSKGKWCKQVMLNMVSQQCGEVELCQQ